MFDAVRPRDVDKLLPVTDGQLAQKDKEYLDKHGINLLLQELLSNLVVQAPLDPIQFCIDSVELSPEFAKQDPATGLPNHRRSKLVDVFKAMDVDCTGTISFDGLQDFTKRYGGETLTEEELQSIFRDFAPKGSGRQITMDEFLAFFSKVSRTMTNKTFLQLVRDLVA